MPADNAFSPSPFDMDGALCGVARFPSLKLCPGFGCTSLGAVRWLVAAFAYSSDRADRSRLKGVSGANHTVCNPSVGLVQGR